MSVILPSGMISATYQCRACKRTYPLAFEGTAPEIATGGVVNAGFAPHRTPENNVCRNQVFDRVDE